MNTKIFTIGKETFHDWIESHKDVEDLTLRGTILPEHVESFEKDLFTLKLKVLRLDNFSVSAYYYKNGSTENFVDAVLSDVCNVYGKISIFTKIIINSDRVQNFIFSDGWIFSEDKKTLIHAPENVTDYVHPEGVAYIGKCAFSGYTNLKSVVFNKSLVEIGTCAFAECNADFPNSAEMAYLPQ